LKDGRGRTTIACMPVGKQSDQAEVDRRKAPRVALACSCDLSRANGSVVGGRTLDVGCGGMRIATERPLGIDEVLEFQLTAGADAPVHGKARVLREQAHRVYALRFERLAADVAAQLMALVDGPLVCLHGFLDTWRAAELMLGALERHHDVLAPTLPGHAGGPALRGAVTAALMADAVEAAMDAAGFATAHLVGTSLGGWVALQLAARGRARTVVAFAPAGGWAAGDPQRAALLRLQAELHAQARAAAPHADALVATAAGRRQATRLIAERAEHLPAALLAHQLRGVAACAAAPLLAFAHDADWSLDAERIACPVRVVWGLEDRLLPWPSAAARYRRDWLPHADWVLLDGVGHCPPLDVPLEAAQLVLGLTA
jgi:pimeloyl-ACP methyl ester carboxylesterase